MFDFKKFFSYHNTDFILEARRGETPEGAVLLDEEDLDFLYQVDYKNWTNAMSTRYEVLLDELKRRDDTRKKIEALFLKEFIKSYPTKEDRSNISLDSFVDFVKIFAGQYSDKGKRIPTPIEEKVKFKNWEKEFREEYSENFDRAKRKGSKDFISDLRYFIFNYIVPFVDEKDKYSIKTNLEDSSPASVSVKFYINRLIQKLETTQGESITLPGNEGTLLNLSKVLMREIPVEMQSKGQYGFDLNAAKMKGFKLGSNEPYALGKTRGFTFPSTRGPNGIEDLMRKLMKLNYQRHMGPLPSDENFKKYSGSDESGSPILSYQQVGANKRGRSVGDDSTYGTLKRKISNKILGFIRNNKMEDSWSRISDLGLYKIIDASFKDEIETGSWAASSSQIVNFIYKNKSQDKGLEIWKTNMPKERQVQDYASIWKHISGNPKIWPIFSNYFAEKQVKLILAAGLGGPRILDGETPEERRLNFDRLDLKLKKLLEDKLSKEELDEFINSGRLPLKLTKSGNKLAPGSLDYSPLILPFLKTIGPDGKEISVPLIKPGKYLSGLGQSEDDKDDENEDENENEDEDEDSKEGRIVATPSTSDRTSVYKVRDQDGIEREVKVIDAKSTDRHLKKAGTGGVYMTHDTKGQARRYSFSKWSRTDLDKFIKVWSHPDMAGQSFDKDAIINKYKQFFGEDITSIYQDIDSYDFYKDKSLPKGLPLVLNGYMVDYDKAYTAGRRYNSENDKADQVGVSSTTTSNNNKTIIQVDPGQADIIGFGPVMDAIKICLKKQGITCYNDGNDGFIDYLLDDANVGEIQKLHDYMVRESVSGGNRGIWKSFLGEGERKKNTTRLYCSIMGKWLQANSNKWSGREDVPLHGQVGRKNRIEVIGNDSIERFKKDREAWLERLNSPKELNKSSNTSSSKKLLTSLRSVKVLGDEDDDQITEWFYPGYKDLDSKSKGNFIANKDNFKPVEDDWRFGAPTELSHLLKSFIENNKGNPISQDDKDLLLNKINQEKEFLVGSGSIEEGEIGLKSPVFNDKIFDKTPEDSESTIKQTIIGLHQFTKICYDDYIKSISKISINEKTVGDEDKEEKKDKIDVLDDEQNEYIRDFKQNFLSIYPSIRSTLLALIPINAEDAELTRTVFKLSNFIGQSGGSNEIFINTISSLYYMLGNSNESLVKTFSSFANRVTTRTTAAEQEFVRKNPGSSTKDFLRQVELVSNQMVSLNFKFNSLVDNLIDSLSKDENYRKSLGLFIRQLKDNKVLSDEVSIFIRSNLYKPGGLKAPEGIQIPPYKDNSQEIENTHEKVLNAVRSSKSVLRRVDASNLLNDPNFKNIGKINKLEIIQVIKAQVDISKKKDIAKRVKEYYVSINSWNSLDSYFKSFIDNTINQ